jgi:hypothetical protein
LGEVDGGGVEVGPLRQRFDDNGGGQGGGDLRRESVGATMIKMLFVWLTPAYAVHLIRMRAGMVSVSRLRAG